MMERDFRRGLSERVKALLAPHRSRPPAVVAACRNLARHSPLLCSAVAPPRRG